MKKSIPVLAMIVFLASNILLLLYLNAYSDDTIYIPPPPDKNKTLPANDGELDGCNSSRFKCVMGGEAVQDNQTGLIWARNADIVNKPLPWKEAMEFCQNLEIANRKGWRLPTKEEFISILDTSQSNPALPDGHPFNNVPQLGSGGTWGSLWTSTEKMDDSSQAFSVGMNLGRIANSNKLFDYLIWPVLGGN
jgi:hypothetical protein